MLKGLLTASLSGSAVLFKGRPRMIRPRLRRLAPPLAALLLGCSALTGPAQAGWLFGGGDDDARPAASSAPAPAKPATDIAGNVQQAKMLRLAGHYQEAIHRLSQLMLVAADDGRVVGEYGKTLAQMGRAQDAVDFLTRARQLDADDWTILSALGVAYDELGDQDKARTAYEQALKLKPDEPSILNNYALSRLLAHDPAGAHALANRIGAGGGTLDPKIARNLAMIEDMAPSKDSAPRQISRQQASKQQTSQQQTGPQQADPHPAKEPAKPETVKQTAAKQTAAKQATAKQTLAQNLEPAATPGAAAPAPTPASVRTEPAADTATPDTATPDTAGPALSTATAYAVSSPDGDQPFVRVPDAPASVADKAAEAPRVVMQPLPQTRKTETPKAEAPAPKAPAPKAHAAPRVLAKTQENPAVKKAAKEPDVKKAAAKSAPVKAPVKAAVKTAAKAPAKAVAKAAAKTTGKAAPSGNAIPALRLSANAY